MVGPIKCCAIISLDQFCQETLEITLFCGGALAKSNN